MGTYVGEESEKMKSRIKGEILGGWDVNGGRTVYKRKQRLYIKFVPP